MTGISTLSSSSLPGLSSFSSLTAPASPSTEKPPPEALFFRDHKGLPGSMVNELRRVDGRDPSCMEVRFLAASVAAKVAKEVEAFHALNYSESSNPKKLTPLMELLEAGAQVLTHIQEGARVDLSHNSRATRLLEDLKEGVGRLHDNLDLMAQSQPTVSNWMDIKQGNTRLLEDSERCVSGSKEYRDNSRPKTGWPEEPSRDRLFKDCFGLPGEIEKNFRTSRAPYKLAVELGNTIGQQLAKAVAVPEVFTDARALAKLTLLLSDAQHVLGQMCSGIVEDDSGAQALVTLLRPTRNLLGYLSIRNGVDGVSPIEMKRIEDERASLVRACGHISEQNQKLQRGVGW